MEYRHTRLRRKRGRCCHSCTSGTAAAAVHVCCCQCPPRCSLASGVMQNLCGLQASNRQCRHEQQQSLATALPSYSRTLCESHDARDWLQRGGCSRGGAAGAGARSDAWQFPAGGHLLPGMHVAAMCTRPADACSQHANAYSCSVYDIFKMSNILI